MAIDTPATIAILGAGPLGLEAALYARFLGYQVILYEQGEVAEHVRRAAHWQLFEPFAERCTSLALAAIHAQDESYVPPAAEERLTGGTWRERYLLPLANTDLLADSLRLHTRVLGIAKGELLKGDLAGNVDRGDWPFRVLTISAAGEERVDEVDVVIDCTGVFSQPNRLGEGGLPALGERALADRIAYHLPDILGAEKSRYAGKHTVVVGGGCSAASSALGLLTLAEAVPNTQITWITRRERALAPNGPLRIVPEDPIPERIALAQSANAAALAGGQLTWRPGCWIERIVPQAAGFELRLTGEEPGILTCDEIIANVGYQPDHRLLAELRVVPCPITGGLLPSGDGISTSEPNFYILGAKAQGRRSGFRFQEGLRQIRDLFRILGDRPALDLYTGAVKLG